MRENTGQIGHLSNSASIYLLLTLQRKFMVYPLLLPPYQQPRPGLRPRHKAQLPTQEFG